MLFSVSRTNIDIDDSLIRKARKLTGLRTKREIVHKALQLLVHYEGRKGVREKSSYKGAMLRALARKPFLRTKGRYLSREEAHRRSSRR